jgi:hypothetical protein
MSAKTLAYMAAVSAAVFLGMQHVQAKQGH